LCRTVRLARTLAPPFCRQKLLGIGDAGDSIGIMKIQPAANRTKAFTRTELFAVIGVVVVLERFK
jgi:hypothetical protein